MANNLVLDENNQFVNINQIKSSGRNLQGEIDQLEDSLALEKEQTMILRMKLTDAKEKSLGSECPFCSEKDVELSELRGKVEEIDSFKRSLVSVIQKILESKNISHSIKDELVKVTGYKK